MMDYRRAAVLLVCSGIVAVVASGRTPASSAEPAATDEVKLLKDKVAQATRMLAGEGIIASSGHVSARIPGTDRVVIGPAFVTRDILTAEDVATVDLNSTHLDGPERPPAETEIHTGIYRARSDVMSVVHSHPVHSVVFSITKKPILPVSVHGAIFADGVPTFDHVGHVNTRELGDALARTLGSRRAELIKMHRAAIVGASVEEAFVATLQLEENAEKQLWAAATGTVEPMTPADVERSNRQSFQRSSIEKRWRYYQDKTRGGK